MFPLDVHFHVPTEIPAWKGFSDLAPKYSSLTNVEESSYKGS